MTLAQIPQVYGWTCAACATEYVERGSGAGRSSDVYANREAVVYAIGYPDNISPGLGLHDGRGTELQRVLREHAGLQTEHGYLSFDEAYETYSQTFGLGSGREYYHWVSFRYAADGVLYIGNSAPGYCGIFSTLTREQYDRLGGWSCLWVTGS